MYKYTLDKAERICSKILIEKMFSGGAKSFSIYPLRVVYIYTEKKETASAAILTSVSKKRFKRAVKRNRVKRQIREAYRKNKFILLDLLEPKEYGLAIAFIYQATTEFASAEIEEKMKIALARIGEKLE